MPLLKLWNSIFGRSAVEPTSATSAKGHESSGPKSTPELRSAPSTSADGPRPAGQKSPGVLSMSFGGPHAAIAKLAKKADPKPGQLLRVLEIGVQDGQRCLAVVAGLTAGRTPEELQYSVIDTFEMGDGPIAMRDFNKLAREASLKPQLFPMPVDAGLVRLAHTLGTVDMILDGDCFHATDDGIRLLPKVMHASTVLLAPQDGKWRIVDRSAGRRKAA